MNEENVKNYSKNVMTLCGIIAIISIIIFICIAIFDSNKSDIATFGMVFGLLIITCVFGFIKFYKQFKNPKDYIPNIAKNQTSSYRGYLYNSEYNWDIAEANYCVQHNKEHNELNDEDEDKIWKYCCCEISFYMAWLLEKNFLTDFLIQELVGNDTIKLVKNRQKTPEILLIDGKLSDEDVKEEILPFLDYCLNDGFESIDNFYNKISEKNTKVFTDKYGELERKRFSYIFNWEDYDEFKKLLNKEYEYSLGE